MPSGTNSPNNNIRPAAYQLLPLTKIIGNNLGGILIADGVGVGKTISASYIILYLSSFLNRSAMVVSPPILVSKWIQELRSKFEMKAFPIRSIEEAKTAKSEAAVRPASLLPPVYILSSSMLGRIPQRDYPEMCVAVFDEIHNLRNRETGSYKSALALALKAPYRVGLSATPINNSLDDLISELSILLAEPSWEGVAEAVRESWAVKKTRLTLPMVTRFTKDRLDWDFVKRKIITKVATYPSDYTLKVKEMIRQLRQKQPSWTSFEEITYFRLAASSHRAIEKALGLRTPLLEQDPKVVILKEILTSSPVSHWLVFCEFEETVSYLENIIDNRVVFSLTGETPLFDRDGIIRGFHDSDSAVLLMTPVGTEGLDLQFCEGVINYDLHWNPMRLEQRVGRIDRVGQEKSSIDIVNVVVAGSIDQRVLEVIRRKLDLISESVFAVGKLFNWDYDIGRSAEQLLDDGALAQELDEGNKLMSALEQNEVFPKEDYALLAQVDLEYCHPSQLRNVSLAKKGEPIWIKEGEVSRVWLRKVSDSGREFADLVKYYR